MSSTLKPSRIDRLARSSTTTASVASSTQATRASPASSASMASTTTLAASVSAGLSSVRRSHSSSMSGEIGLGTAAWSVVVMPASLPKESGQAWDW